MEENRQREQEVRRQTRERAIFNDEEVEGSDLGDDDIRQDRARIRQFLEGNEARSAAMIARLEENRAGPSNS
ncbi:unnamed protein product [Calypogeia fissa]